MRNQNTWHYILGWLFVAILFSCNSISYKHIANNPPKSDKARVNGAKGLSKWYPNDTTGKRTTDNTDTLRKAGRSTPKPMQKPVVTTKLEIQYRDTCTSAIERYNEALEVGYQKGFFDGRESLEPDTLEITKTITNDITIRDNKEVILANDNAASEKKRADKAESRASTRMTIIWCLLGFILLMGLFAFFFGKSLFKSKPKP